MVETLTLNPWFYGFVGLGAGTLLSRVGRWLIRTRNPLNASTFNTQPSTGNVKGLDVWLVIATGAGFAAVWEKYGLSAQTVIVSTYYSVFLLIFVLDIAHRWVPNALLVPAAIVALAASLLTGRPPVIQALLGGIVGFVWFYLMAMAYRGALGAGDVKLAGLIGLITGFPNVLIALTIGILIGGVAAALLLISGRKTRKSYIPYAPFLVTGALMTLIYRL